MTHRDCFFVDGRWDAKGDRERCVVQNPATEGTIAEIPLGTPADVDEAVAAAQRAFEGYCRSSREMRLALLDRLAAGYERRIDEIAETISAEMGAPRWFARKFQAPAGLSNLRVARAVLATFPFETTMDHTIVLREPAGVCGLITPWNWPINQIACKVGPALAAGCTMVLKPSEVAPLNAVIFAELIEEAGVPRGVFNLVHGTGPVAGAALAAHRGVDVLSFTGSTEAGRAVAAAAASTIKRVALELGGKSANVLLPSADFKAAVPLGVRGCFDNAGQSCSAPTRMFVPKARLEEVLALAKQAAEAVRVGPPDQPGVDLGPVVSQRQYERIQTLIASGLSEGATLLTGGLGRPAGFSKGYYVRPTVFHDVRNEMRIAQEEIFGPVLCLLGYEDVDEAVALANATRYGLSGYVVGEAEEAAQVARRLRTGNVHLNGAPQDIAAPFGGYKESGIGRERGVFGLAEFLETKAIMAPREVPQGLLDSGA